MAALPARWDSVLYDPARPLGPRIILYCLDKLLLILRGVARARQFHAELVFAETAHHALAGLGIARILGIRCVWDSHGNGKVFYENGGKGRASIRLITILERFLGRHVDALITVSEADATAYAEMGVPPSKIHVVPLCVDLAEVDSAAGSPLATASRAAPVILFFGSFRYAPNREGLEFVNTYLAPTLERRGVQCEIRIAGRDIPALDFHPFVRPIGFVTNIYAAIREADVSIVPVRRGVGVLTKVIDSMAVGTPLVLFEFAARGIPALRSNVHAYVAKTDEEFLIRTVEAIASPESARTMAAKARRLVEREHDWDAYLGEIDRILWPARTIPRTEDHEGRGHHAER